MKKNHMETLFLTLMGLVILLMVMNILLFLRMNQMQQAVVIALQPFQRPSGLAIGAKAPGFKLAELEGRIYSLEDYAGKNLILVFSSTSCSGCKAIYPVLKQFTETFSETPLLMISKGKSEENLSLRQIEGLSIPILNWQDEMVNSYRVPGTPYYYLINTQGVIAAQGILSSLEQLKKAANP